MNIYCNDTLCQKVKIQQYSHNSDVVKFVVDRYKNDVDLSEKTVRLSIQDIDFLEVGTDSCLTVVTDDDTVTVVWTVSNQQTQKYGVYRCQLSFVDSTEYAEYMELFDVEFMHSVKPSDYEEVSNPTIWDEYLAEVKELKEAAEEAAEKASGVTVSKIDDNTVRLTY